MFSYAIGHEDGRTSVFNMIKDRRTLELYWADTSIAKIMHNAKFDLTMVKMEGIHIPPETEIHDTMIMSQLLRNLAPSHALDYLCWELCGYTREMDKEMKLLGQSLGGYQNIPAHKMNKYQKADVERGQLLFQTFYPEIKKDRKLHQDYLNEIELIKTTIRMEETGICIDTNKCIELINWMETELDGVLADTQEIFGEWINLNADTQVARVLYKKLKMPILRFTATKLPATDKNTLAQLREQHPHPVLDLILKQRAYTKGIAIIRGYMAVTGEDKRIHPTINTNKARTGRESSQNPNLQNVSKKEVLLNPFPVPARKVFVCPDQCILLLVDYAGIEMRLIIDQCGEEEMLKAVNRGGDVHDMASEVLFGDIYRNEKNKERKKVLRSAGKNANFAVPYGAGGAKIATTLGIEQLGISLDTFTDNFKEYQNRWPKIAFFTRTIIEQVREFGYVSTPFGRRLYVPRDKAYSGGNYLIQGTAGGVLKRAQTRVDTYLKNNWLDKIKLVLPIHDELIISFPKSLLKLKDRIIKDISKIMCDMPEIQIKLDVEWKETYTNWDEAKEITIN